MASHPWLPSADSLGDSNLLCSQEGKATLGVDMAIPAGAPDALKPCRQGLCAPGNGGIVMVVRVEGCGLVVVDAQGGQGAREHEGLLQLQLSPLDVVSGACTAMLVLLSRDNTARAGSRA